jgi:hypothetical protein
MKHYNRSTQRITRALFLLVVICAAALGVSAQESRRGTGPRDPFVPYKPVIKVKTQKATPTPVTPPTIQARIDKYKAQKLEAMRAQKPVPKPTTVLLLSEMQVIGITRTPRGYAAMVEATPIKLTYVIYPGEQFYDGQLVAIEENRLVFRHETLYSDGKSQTNVEVKPLRQANSVSDSLAATTTTRSADEKSAASNTAAANAADKQ